MKLRLSIAAAGLLVAGIASRAELVRWVQNIAAGDRLEAVFFRAVNLPAGAVEIRRPPKETRVELGKLIASAPSDSDLYALRAREDELQLDFTAAENDWKKAAQLATGKIGAELDLADFYARRIRPQEEVATLESAGKMPSPADERLTPPSQQQSWKAFERALGVIREQALPESASLEAYQAWIARYPNQPAIYRQFLDYLTSRKQFDEAAKLLAAYRKAFPADETYPVQAEANIAWRRGSLDDAIRIYDQSFRPLWPPELVKSYFDLLKEAHALRRYLEQSRSLVASKPTDLGAAARVFYYYQQQGNLAAAQRALFECRLRKEAQKSPWIADELLTLGQLFEGANNYDEAARSDYALYSLAGASPAEQEKALSGIANLLLSAPEQPMRLGAADLSMYRDIAQLDPGPGFLNGILSLVFNSSSPESQFSTEDAASVAYFHRAAAAELVRLFDSRFPASAERPRLNARLIEAYATYGDSDGVIRAGRQFLAAFPKASERTEVAIVLSDAYARKNQIQQELTIYDGLLKELAAAADGVPIGAAPTPSQAGAPDQAQADQAQAAQARPARSPEYARILDRYISRLVALKRVRDALALYRREIDRNPADPGLYERLAAFLDENRMGAEVEQVYRRAMAQFSDRSWSHKLARWYLRQKRTAQVQELTEEVVKIFSGTELENYLQDVSSGQALGPVLYRQVNLYAHQRFPHDLAFVRNLLIAYSQPGTVDRAAEEALLRRYWFYAPDLRDRFFERLSAGRSLDAELASIKGAAPANTAEQALLAEASAWRSHFEEAAPVMRTLAADYPSDADVANRAASLYRSLATYDSPGDLRNTRIAAGIERNLANAAPRDSSAWTRLGEIYADRELYSRAKPAWDHIAQIRPGESGGYIEAATIFWDYFRYSDALRLIDEGRKKLADPALFAYEAGAIYENERNYPKAIAEYASGALNASGDTQARGRLIQLAKRTRDRDVIEKLTVERATAANADVNAISLRADLLGAENRRKDLEQFLLETAGRANSLELVAYVEQSAVREGFDAVQEQALRRRIVMLTDPVEQMHERLALARFYEGQRNVPAATQIIADLYREHPTILGVIRATVDFYWRNKNQKDAIDVLVAAASAGQPAYRKQFDFEAARKSTDASDFERARSLLAVLLKDDPFDSQYLAAMADTYARAGDDAGLRDFYTGKMKQIAAAPLSPADRTEKLAGLRRGLIPVLTRLKDYSGAVDQYIEIINRYPDDEALIREAALYAASHGRAKQIADYYAKTEKDSPKDYRWPMTLARIDTALEDFSSAIAEYRRASDVRPDRIDLYTARGALEERLMRFDDAAATYSKLYELNYHNSQWMEEVAGIRARQGRNDDAVEALRRALIEGRPKRPEMFFAMAEKLESWGLVSQARTFAEQGVAAAGDSLNSDFSHGAELYARLMTRSRAYQKVYEEIESPLPIAKTAATYFTPEEKRTFATFLRGKLANPTVESVNAMIALAQNAGLADLSAELLNQQLTISPGGPPQALIDYQQQRLRYAELAHQLEAYWKIVPADTANRDGILGQAVEKFGLAGDAAAELRLLDQLDQRRQLGGDLLTRYAELLSRNPQRFLTTVKSDASPTVRNALAQYALAKFDAARALEIIAARGAGEQTVWQRSYMGLAGLYFADAAPQVNAAFRDVLGTGTVGERLGKPVDRTQQLAGDLWFYYGSRYGEYLGVTKHDDPEDYLPASLEATPGQSDAYFNLAEYYREANQPERALSDYANALQLDPQRADVHDRIAVIYSHQNKSADATREFSSALQALARQEDSRIREDFWRTLATTLQDVGHSKLFEAVRPEADKVLRTYIRRSGSYQVDVLLTAALKAAGDPADGVAWIVDLSRSAADRPQFLAAIVTQPWIPEDQRAALYRALIRSAQQKLDNTYGEARGWMETELRNHQFEWVQYLVDHKQAQAAHDALAEIPEETRKARIGQTAALEVRIAAQLGTLKSLLDHYAADPTSSPPDEILQNAATDLGRVHEDAAARQVLEFVYTHQIDAYRFSAATFLGLAEIRLEQGDLKSAVALLHRMSLVAGEPFDNLADAGDLLARMGHSADALPFFADRVRAVPWDLEAKAKYARLLVSAAKDRDEGMGLLRAVAESSDAPYEIRASAAQLLGEAKSKPLETSSVELNLLSGPSPIPAANAEKPYFYHARFTAAAQTHDAAIKLRLLEGAVAIDPALDDPKLMLFEEAYAAKRYQTAIAALYPLIHGRGINVPAEPPANAGNEPVENPYENQYLAASFLTGRPRSAIFANLLPAPDPTRRARIAADLADCYAKLSRIREAEFYFGIAVKIDPGNSAAKAQLASLHSQVALLRANRRRQPAITPNLEQDHLVRPRLAAAPNSSVGGGQ